jgi:molybdate transport system substrate-binding protein
MSNLSVMCARAMHQPMQQLSAEFGTTSGHAVALSFGTVGALKARLAAGEEADVIIGSVPMIADLEQAGTIAAGSRAVLGRTSIGVAIRAGSRAPDIATAESFKRALLAARAIAVTDAAAGGSAGVYLPGLFERLGIAATIEPKLKRQRGGDEVAECVARGEAELGMTLISEIVPVQGVVVIGPLPPELGHDTTYAAGVSARSRVGDAALALIRFLSRPAARPIWQAAGFVVPQ